MADIKARVALACRILASRGLVRGTLGHISVRTGTDTCLIRARSSFERGLSHTVADDIRMIDFSGRLLETETDRVWSVPAEHPIHTMLYRRRPEVRSVVHAHPRSALLAGLAGLTPKAVFGAFNIPAMRMAREGIPVYPRAVLIARDELAEEMIEAMGSSQVCLLRGHGITVTAPTLEGAVVAAVNLHELLSVTVDLAVLHATPEEVPERDLRELPDLGSTFNDTLAWQSLVADLD